MKRFRAILIGGLLLGSGFAHAEEAASGLSCVESLKQVCTGLEDNLERCVTERTGQLSEECREMVKSYTSVMQLQNGPAVCVQDVQRLCPGQQLEAMYTCIAEKKTGFSAACQDYLATAHEMPDHHH